MALEVSHLERLLGDEWREALPPICLDCGYDLTGLPSNRCPECGNVFVRADVVRQARQLRNQLRQLRTSNDLLRFGWYLGLGAGGGLAILAVLGFVVHPEFRTMGSIFGLFGGVPTTGLGLQVLRVLRLPVWARERMEGGPDVYRGVALAMLGLGMLVASVLLLW